VEGGALVVETGHETDFWRTTAYGFVHHNGHLFGRPLPRDAAVEVTFRAGYEADFDQAGLMLRGGPEVWLKAGVELSDGQLWASVVATDGHSDWSVAPLPAALGDTWLTFRASRRGDGVTVRYRADGESGWRLLRVAYLPPHVDVVAGPMCCSPSRAGLSARFARVRVGPPDERLHEG
jgi:regulation of enolase protein 1 (concanavalin A-like superfamily)